MAWIFTENICVNSVVGNQASLDNNISKKIKNNLQHYQQNIQRKTLMCSSARQENKVTLLQEEQGLPVS